MTSAALVFRFDRASTVHATRSLSSVYEILRGTTFVRTVEIAMPNVHIVDALIGDTWGDLLPLLLHF